MVFCGHNEILLCHGFSLVIFFLYIKMMCNSVKSLQLIVEWVKYYMQEYKFEPPTCPLLIFKRWTLTTRLLNKKITISTIIDIILVAAVFAETSRFGLGMLLLLENNYKLPTYSSSVERIRGMVTSPMLIILIVSISVTYFWDEFIWSFSLY